jgi:DNA-binding NarL/FixJ family response regulator
MKKRRILLADDHRIVREKLRDLLGKMHNVEMVIEVENGKDAVKMAEEFYPDVVVMDIGMPVLNGIDATRQIRAKAPQVKIIALSVHKEKRYILEMLKAGAMAYLVKDKAFEELSRAIQSVCANKFYVNADVADEEIQGFIRSI